MSRGGRRTRDSADQATHGEDGAKSGKLRHESRACMSLVQSSLVLMRNLQLEAGLVLI